MPLAALSRAGSTAVLSYSNPPHGTMTHPGAEALLAEFRPAEADQAVRCVVIAGGLPGVFVRYVAPNALQRKCRCAGRHYYVAELRSWAEKGAPARADRYSGDAPARGFPALLDAVSRSRKPVIAAVNGTAMGLALACDIRVCGRDVAQIGFPEATAGIFPGGGGTQRLPRIVGEAAALEIVLRGLVFTAEEAHRRGIVHELAEDPVARALEIGEEFARRSPEAVMQAKRLVRAAMDRPLAEGLADERRSFREVVKSGEAIEGLKAAMEALEGP
ncbi:enoyl-CoA hydratase/isomerase [Hyaloraphidium curvatum]|nr:enoyl-CoA hydratase/isomerase [Hyaloraphidium curvatum]